MWIAVIVLVVGIAAAMRWMQAMEARVDALNAHIGDLERAIRRLEDERLR